IYLIDRDDMGHYTPGGPDRVVQTLPIGQAIFSNPAFFQDGPTSGLIYYHAANDVTRAFRIANGTLPPAAASTTSFGFPGGQPSISASGMGNGIVWEIQADRYLTSGSAVLHAYDALTLTERYNSEQAGPRDRLTGAVKFAVPTITNGHVFVGAQGSRSVFGLFPPRGGFGQPVLLPVGQTPVAVAAVVLPNSPVHLVTANNGGRSFSVLKNLGEGTFERTDQSIDFPPVALAVVPS